MTNQAQDNNNNGGNDRNNGFSLKNLFKHLGKYASENKVEALALGSSLTIGALMATTSLISPLMASPVTSALLLGGSITLLLQNGKTAVANTLGLGNKLGMSAMTMGIIIGSLNTVPEVMVSLSALANGAYELGVGNVVGSHIAHTLLILGVTAATVGIARAQDLSWKFNTYMMAGAAGLFGMQMAMDNFSPLIGASMLGLGSYYFWKRFYKDRTDNPAHDHDHDHDHEHHNHDHDHENDEVGMCPFHDHDDEEDVLKAKERPKWFNTVLAGAGMAGLLCASQLIVGSGVGFAETFNSAALGLDFSQGLVGAIIIALGTAAPEIAISIEAIRKNQGDFAIGNVLGCSITNTLIAGGALSLAGGLMGVAMPETFGLGTNMGLLNFGAFAGTTALLTSTLLATKGALNRFQGAVALGLYASYIGASLYLNGGHTPDTLHQHGPSESQQQSAHEEEHSHQQIKWDNGARFTPALV